MKKVMCPKCGEIFEVDESRDVLPNGCVYCKKCQEPFHPLDGQKKLEQEFKAATSNAYRDLYSKQRYSDACEEYEYALVLKDNDLGAIVGLSLSKIYASTIDKREFLNIIKMFEEHDVLLNAENTFIYLSFVRDAVYTFEQFLKVCRDSIASNEVFFNKTYFDYYVSGIKEIKEVMDYFKDSFSIVDEEEHKSFVEENQMFNKDFETMTNGIHHRLNKEYKVEGVGVIKLTNGEEEVIKKETYGLVVPPQVDLSLLPINNKVLKIKHITIAYYAVLTIAIVTLLILYFVTKVSAYAWCEIIPLLLAAGGYFLFTYLIKKSY